MSALDQLKEMVEAAKAQADKLESLQSGVEKLSQPVEQPAQPDMTEFQGKLDALVKERDALRTAIQAEIDDQSADTKRLEDAIKPVEVAPVPEVPKVDDQPKADAPVADQPVADEPKQDQPAGLPGDAVKPEDVQNPISPLPGA